MISKFAQLGLIKEAKESGIFEEISSSQDNSGARKSGRMRFKPLQYWKNEHIVYERRSSGIGRLMPTIKYDNPIEKPPTPPQNPRKSRPKKRKNDSDEESEKEIDEDPEQEISVYDPETKKMDNKGEIR